MNANFTPALDLLLRLEGGYVDDPHDPGGGTNLGITLATYRAHGHPQADCAELKRLDRAVAADIYRVSFWSAAGCDRLPGGVDVCVFDAAVHSGPMRAVCLLQRALSLPETGCYDAPTLARVADCPPDRLVGDYGKTRLAWMQRLKTWPRYGKGWTTRLTAVRGLALELAASQPIRPAAPPGQADHGLGSAPESAFLGLVEAELARPSAQRSKRPWESRTYWFIGFSLLAKAIVLVPGLAGLEIDVSGATDVALLCVSFVMDLGGLWGRDRAHGPIRWRRDPVADSPVADSPAADGLRQPARPPAPEPVHPDSGYAGGVHGALQGPFDDHTL